MKAKLKKVKTAEPDWGTPDYIKTHTVGVKDLRRQTKNCVLTRKIRKSVRALSSKSYALAAKDVIVGMYKPRTKDEKPESCQFAIVRIELPAKDVMIRQKAYFQALIDLVGAKFYVCESTMDDECRGGHAILAFDVPEKKSVAKNGVRK